MKEEIQAKAKMSASQKMTLRVQSPDGTARLEAAAEESTARLYERVHEALRLSSFAFALHRDRARRDELAASKARSLAAAGLRHGDMLYLSPLNGAVLFDQSSTSSEINRNIPVAGPSSASTSSVRPPTKTAVQEDDIDIELFKLDGKIQRQRDDKLCRHNSKGCCVHCSPLEPYDEGYLQEHNIKHLSFHSYLRKIMNGNKFVSLDEISCTIKPGCKEHPPWPRGVCSGCAPAPVTLARQPWRHVDNVLFPHAACVERFLGYWRATGHQRAAWLYGRYEPHDDVPLGIRARVLALYEPAQASARDRLQLAPDAREAALAALAAELRLTRLGWIFTDLLPDQAAAGRVQHIRGVESHFLSAAECLTAAHFQQQHPNACHLAPSGYFGSKFVTVCVSGDASGQVALEGYQVSRQWSALAAARLLLPTRDAPDLAAVPERAPLDVYYKEKDQYGNEVSVRAKQIPVAYSLVSVPVGVAGAGAGVGAGTGAGAGAFGDMFSPRATFPPAHRPLQNQLQTLKALHEHLEASESFLEAMSDLHVLLFLMSNDALPLPLEALRPLLAAVRAGDAAAAEAWRRGPAWATLEELARSAADQDVQAHSDSGGELWTCPHCTFHNAARAPACDMCALPRGNSM